MSRNRRNQHEATQFDFLYVILCFFLSTIPAALGYVTYLKSYFRQMPLRVGLAFFVFSLTLFFLLLFLSLICKRFKENVITGRRRVGSVSLILLGVSAAIMLLASLFQWCYQLNFSTGKKSDAYVFLVDISESMDWNDGNGLRYDAIDDLIEDRGKRFPYMIYTFNHESSILRDMATTAEEDGYTHPSKNSGGTQIFNALSRVIDDYNSGSWKETMDPQVILITDAEADNSSMSSNEVLDAFIEADLPVSTVFLGGGNMQTLKDVAEATGGNYTQISTAEDLSDALFSVSRGTRSLLEFRYVEELDGVYAALRILFLTLLGLAIGFGIMMAYGRHETGKFTLISALVKSLVTAILFEVFVQFNVSVHLFVFNLDCAYAPLMLWFLAFPLVRMSPDVRYFYDSLDESLGRESASSRGSFGSKGSTSGKNRSGSMGSRSSDEDLFF